MKLSNEFFFFDDILCSIGVIGLIRNFIQLICKDWSSGFSRNVGLIYLIFLFIFLIIIGSYLLLPSSKITSIQNQYCLKPSSSSSVTIKGLNFYSSYFLAAFVITFLFFGEASRSLNDFIYQSSSYRFSAFVPLIIIVPLVWSVILSIYGRERSQINYFQISSKENSNSKIATCYYETISIRNTPLIISACICCIINVIFVHFGLYIFIYKQSFSEIIQHHSIYFAANFIFTVVFMLIFWRMTQLISEFTDQRLSYVETVVLSQTLGLLIGASFSVFYIEKNDFMQFHRIKYHQDDQIFSEDIAGILFVSRFGVNAFILIISEWISSTICKLYSHNPWIAALKYKIGFVLFSIYFINLWFLIDYKRIFEPLLELALSEQYYTIPLFNSSKMCIFFFWAIGCVVSVLISNSIVYMATPMTPYIRIITRKAFHCALVIGFLPIMLFNYNLTNVVVCITIGLHIAIWLELIRVTEIPSKYCSHLIQLLFQKFLDSRDQRGVILTHIYLGLGVGVPIIYEFFISLICHREFDKIGASLGIITVGVADSASALFGYGASPLPKPYSTKSWKGLFAFFLTSLATAGIIIVCTNHALTGRRLQALLVSITVASIFEATSKEIDNYLLSLIALSTYNCLV